jgi:hypothetical protein
MKETQQASGHLFTDDMNGFSSISVIFLMVSEPEFVNVKGA